MAKGELLLASISFIQQKRLEIICNSKILYIYWGWINNDIMIRNPNVIICDTFDMNLMKFYSRHIFDMDECEIHLYATISSCPTFQKHNTFSILYYYFYNELWTCGFVGQGKEFWPSHSWGTLFNDGVPLLRRFARALVQSQRPI